MGKEKQPQQEQIKQQQSSKPVRMEENPRVPTARELLEASYAEIRRANQQEKIDKIHIFKNKCFTLNMKEFTKEDKGSMMFNYVHHLMDKKGFDVNDELIKQINILEMCVKSEHPVPKQLLPFNELKGPYKKYCKRIP